jgi:hypothetical protein
MNYSLPSKQSIGQLLNGLNSLYHCFALPYTKLLIVLVLELLQTTIDWVTISSTSTWTMYCGATKINRHRCVLRQWKLVTITVTLHSNFLGRLDWCYRKLHRQSKLHVPIWWCDQQQSLQHTYMIKIIVIQVTCLSSSFVE